MAWTAPMTFIDGTVLTAPQLNTHFRDNMLETIPAKSTHNGGVGGGYFIVQGPHDLQERGIGYHEVTTSQTTTSTAFVDLATVGPSVGVVTGTSAWLLVSAEMGNSLDGAEVFASVSVADDTTKEASDGYGISRAAGAGSRNAHFGSIFFSDLTPGHNIFTMKYRVGAGTGTFLNRRLWVMPL